jgi:hypothetical protein
MRTYWKRLLALALVIVPMMVQAADWPQWGGPAGDNISPEKGLLKQWPQGGPGLVWTYDDAGTGYTAPVVVDGVVYLMGARNNDEYIFALDAQGKRKWETKIGPMFNFKGNVWSGGPNASPAVRG